MKTPLADKKYKKEVVRLVRKLPFNVGVKFHDDVFRVPGAVSDFLNIHFQTMRGEREYTKAMTIRAHMPPADYLVKRIAYDLLEAMLDDEEDDS